MRGYKSLTIQFHGLAESISSDCGICEAFDPMLLGRGKKHPAVRTYHAVWDTGASKSSVSQKVVDELGLKPVGVGVNHTAAGPVPTHLYLINMLLPCDVGIPVLTVTCSDLGDIDVLIGMDVINKGDFSITNVGGKTTFSFRIPSLETIDYVKQKPCPVVPVVKEKEPGRNDPCPCGSGKKYKNCHGKK